MGINPFGEDSDSLQAWKERSKQQKFQIQTLQTSLSETNTELEKVEEELAQKSERLEKLENQLSQTKQELRSFKSIAKEKQEKIDKLEQLVDEDNIKSLRMENKRLKEEIEGLKSQLIREQAGGQSSTISEDTNLDSDKISNAMIPYMLSKYHPNDKRFDNAYKNLVESVIEDGNIMARIIGILIKYGGRGPKDRIESMVKTKKFEPALDLLEEENIIVRIEDEIVLVEDPEIEGETYDRDDKTTLDLFNDLEYSAKNDKTEVLINNFVKFRDTLQEREIPLTTIFFEIRKLIEKLERDQISRKDVVKQIITWEEKYQSLNN